MAIICLSISGGGHTIVSNVSFCCEDDNCKIDIGEDFTMEGGHIASTEGAKITIGNDCMFSGDVEIRNGDSHVVLDTATGKRINYAKDISIGNHVWLTAHVRVLKGSRIASNTIVGSSAVVSSCLSNENSIYAGIPCKEVKQGVDWDRFRDKFTII